MLDVNLVPLLPRGIFSQLPFYPTPIIKTRESELKGHTAAIDQLAWKATEPVFATVSGDKSCRIWDARSSELCIDRDVKSPCLATLAFHASPAALTPSRFCALTRRQLRGGA